MHQSFLVMPVMAAAISQKAEQEQKVERRVNLLSRSGCTGNQRKRVGAEVNGY